MARPKKEGAIRRVQVRLPERLAPLFDSYTSDEIGLLLAKALDAFSPGSAVDDGLVSVVRPARPISTLLVRTFVQARQILLLYPEKCDVFRDEVKALGYEWQAPYWVKAAAEAVVMDRAAEVVHRLLLAGFCVQVHSTALKERAIAAKYEPEHYRKVSVGKVEPWVDWFKISWPRGEDFYEEAKSITGARYSSGSVYVPPEMFAEVQDFADIHDFWLSVEAESLMSKAKQAWESVEIVDIQEHQKRRRRRKSKAKPSEGIPDELRDDD